MQQNKLLKVVMAGATGLVGRQLLTLLCKHDHIAEIVLLTRRAISPAINSPKVKEHIINFDMPNSYADLVKGDIVFCCLGATMAVAKTKANFYKVDFTYVYDLAKAAKQNNIGAFHMVSSLGADSKSFFYYSKVKGEIQASVKALNFETCCFYQPSLLLGPRLEKRSFEQIAQNIIPFFNPIIPLKYKAISGEDVAKAMLNRALDGPIGQYELTSDLLHKLSKHE